MIKVRGFNLENSFYNDFLIWAERKNINLDLIGREDFKGFIEEFKEETGGLKYLK